MSRKSSKSRSAHETKPPIREISSKLSKISIGSTRRISSKNFSIENLVDSIRDGKFKRIVVLAGAGISTPSGIPDFRTPGTGLYDNLQRYKIPYPEAIFELNYFHRNPKPFFLLAKELFPGRFSPNVIHYFIRFLHDRNLLHRVYTQNIDGLERIAGIPAEKLVEAHGTFLTATCLKCQQKYRDNEIREEIFDNQIPRCRKTARCSGIVKPDIVFFGEDLPRRFQLYSQDLPMSDCCIVMGTSLEVFPFAEIVDSTVRSTPRLLINRHVVGTFLSPRPFDLTMVGDLESNVKSLLTKLDVIGPVIELMKKENFEREQNRPSINRPVTAKTNERLKLAQNFVEQRRKFSTLTNPKIQENSTSRPSAPVNETTKNLIEEHNNNLILRRQRSKSAFPIVTRKKNSSSSSSSSSSNSLNSSLSDIDLSPFAFKQNSKSEIRTSFKPVALAASRIKANPLLTATLRTDH